VPAPRCRQLGTCLEGVRGEPDPPGERPRAGRDHRRRRCQRSGGGRGPLMYERRWSRGRLAARGRRSRARRLAAVGGAVSPAASGGGRGPLWYLLPATGAGLRAASASETQRSGGWGPGASAPAHSRGIAPAVGPRAVKPAQRWGSGSPRVFLVRRRPGRPGPEIPATAVSAAGGREPAQRWGSGPPLVVPCRLRGRPFERPLASET